MPYRMMMSLEPIVMHGSREFTEGASLAHVLREATMMGALVGAGLPVHEAITAFERKEPKLTGLGLGEAWEGVHAAHRGGRTSCGCGQHAGTMMMPGVMSKMPAGMVHAGATPCGMMHPGMMHGGMMPGMMAQRAPGVANVAVPTVVLVF